MSRKRSEEAIEALRARFVAGALATGRRRRARERDLRQARRLLRVRLPEVALGRVRAARLPVGLAAPPLPGRVPLRAPERPADGLLPAGEPRPRRPAARGGGAAAGRQPERAKCSIEDGGRPDRASATSARSARTEAEAVAAGQPYADVADLARRAPVGRTALDALVASVRCDRFGERRDLLWRPVSSRGRRPSATGSSSSPSRSSRRTRPRAPAADRLGAHAGRLRDDEPLGRLAPARALAAPSAAWNDRERRADRASGPARWPSPAWRSPASGRRPRTEWSSCCSRTRPGR
jgi:hypothetical protein